MMKNLCAVSFLVASLYAGNVYAQPAAVKKIIEIGTTDNRVMHQLDVLTNRFGGRPIGSDAYDNAAEWMLREFRSWGIEAHLEEAGELPVGFNRGPWFGRLIGGDQPMNLHFVTPSYTSGTKGLQRGHVLIEPATEAELKRMRHQLKGAWVLVSGQMMVKIVHDELAELMGGKNVEVDIKGNPAIILMSGLQGSGKTTFSGKFANLLKNKKGKKPLLVACDVYRPAAIEQLKVLGEQIQVPVYSDETTKDPVRIALDAIKQAKAKGYDVVIVDTAGRLAIDEQMMNEIAAIKEAIHPNETLFVVDAMTGQDAVNTAREFNERLDFNGVILTKLDGDTRGGAALSIRTVVNKPIKYVGTGEKLEALDAFHPERMADRILGMGDIVSLVEKAQEQFDAEEAKKLQKKISRNQFNFNDFLSQIQQIKKMSVKH